MTIRRVTFSFDDAQAPDLAAWLDSTPHGEASAAIRDALLDYLREPSNKEIMAAIIELRDKVECRPPIETATNGDGHETDGFIQSLEDQFGA